MKSPEFKKTVLLASDHAGFALKGVLRDFLVTEGYRVEDLGAKTFEDGDDYPALIVPLAMRVSEQPDKCMGIILGMSGQGEAIVANRFPAVRAIVYYGEPQAGGASSPADDVANSANSATAEGPFEAHSIIKLGREHNDSNVLSLGAHFLTDEQAKAAVSLWLTTPFSGEERHQRRIEMIDSIS